MKTKMVVQDRGPGFQQLVADLAGAELTIGVHTEEGAQMHPDADMTVGEVMALHELGLGGQKERSWLRKFLDHNEARYTSMAAEAFRQIVAGGSRKKLTERLGYVITDEMRGNIADGKITPALAASTIAAKGHSIPLLATAKGVNAITFKLKLRQIKSVAKEGGAREALRKK